MNTVELLKKLIDRIKKFSWVIVLMGLLFAGFFYYLAKQNVTVYIGRSTVFPLNATVENSVSEKTISSILGLADAPKSFTADASINIVELANSRRTREAVAGPHPFKVFKALQASLSLSALRNLKAF